MLNQYCTIHSNLLGISKRAKIFVLVSVDSIGYLPVWCGHFGAATMVCTIRCGDSMVLVFMARDNMVQWCEEFFCSLEFLVALIRAVF